MGERKHQFKEQCIGVLGAGRFGRAFLEGVVRTQLCTLDQLWASARSEKNLKMVETMGVRAVADFEKYISESSILILSVKPAQIEEVLEKINSIPSSHRVLLISVAAGTSCSKIENILKYPWPVIRAMPNSPCGIGEGITALCKGSRATDADLKIASKLFDTLGATLITEEKHFDLVTALSGSGPAYFYSVMEAMIEAGVAGGMTKEDVIKLVAQTARGAGTMVLNSERTPDDLRKDVATPGGCTMAALKILESKELNDSIIEAVREAARVAAKLGSK